MIWTNPDGSRLNIPDSDVPDSRVRAPAHVREFLREIGKRGGRERARRHTREELSTWGRTRHGTAQRKNISGRENAGGSSHPRKRTVEECLRLSVRDIKRLDRDMRVDLGHGYTALVRRSAHDLIAVVSGPRLLEGGVTTTVGLKDRPVYGWAKSSGRPITATEFECAGGERAVREG